MTPRPPLGLERWGTITVRGDGPYVASCYYRDITGKRRRMERQGRTKSVARVNLENALHDMLAAGEGDLTRDTTLAALAETWWIEFEATNPPLNTRSRYARTKASVVDAIGSLRIVEATVPKLDRYLNAVHKGRGPSEAKVQRVVLSHMLTLAVRHGAAARNAAADTRLPAAPPRAPKALESETVNDVRAALARYDARAHTAGTLTLFADLLIATGARPSELLALRWDDVDLERGALTIAATVVEDERGRPVRQAHPKTSHGFRRLTLPDFGTAALLDARTRAGTEHVIPNARGGLQHRRGIARAWRDALAAPTPGAAVDAPNALVGITPMAFRKTVATLIARELGPEAAGQQLGHHDDSVTRAFYIERIQAGPEQARSVLDRLLKVEGK